MTKNSIRSVAAALLLALVGPALAARGQDDVPIGEMAEPAEIAELVAFLLRPSQASVNGATFDINGGSYIR